ncbi:disulfide bond formation protein B [Agrobacterium rubi]|nr:disulfide bond formation protein B [Agrobacterium rubi]NTF24856.1 disulfide bond formation protein B [Agrobacterium rubi]
MNPLRISATTAALATASVAILSAWGIQWFGYEPCVLCLRQRIPYYVGIPLMALALGIGRYGGDRLQCAVRPLLFLALACFAVSTVLAGNHGGVEQGWWEGPSSCVTRSLDTSSLDAFAAQLGSTRMVSCNTPSFTMLGFSLAWWNVAVSAMVSGLLSYRILARGGRGL